MPDSTALAPVLAATIARAGEFLQASEAPNTRRAYASDWRDFSRWCSIQGREPLPATPETLALYFTHLCAASKPSTIERRRAAISHHHQAAGIDPLPTQDFGVRKVLAGIRRTRGIAQQGKRPVLTEDLRAMVAPLGSRIQDVRDRALLLIGFAGAFRRSELIGLNAGDVEFEREGLIATIRRSKTDPEGQGRRIGIPYGSTRATCPVRALEAWLHVSGVVEGPVFRAINRHGRLSGQRLTSQSVALVIKRLARQAGLPAADLAGHSLRSGLATTAAMAGVSERAIMAQTGHRSVLTLRKYIREGSLFLENAAAKVGL